MKFTRDEVLDLPGGYLSDRGAFLGGDAGWYPTGAQELSLFILEATVPAEWRVVSEGRLASTAEPRDGRRSERYDAGNALEAISLVAAPWHVREEQRGGSCIAVYALPGTEDSLVETYLAAAAGYVERYTREIGPHAWPQFVVAEHILPTGYGFPSFTLLGSAVMRLPFIVKTSLGHEVLHVETRRRKGRPILFTVSHGRILLPALHHRFQEIVAMVSRSRDGDLAAEVLHHFGYHTVRGSSSRGGGKS